VPQSSPLEKYLYIASPKVHHHPRAEPFANDSAIEHVRLCLSDIINNRTQAQILSLVKSATTSQETPTKLLTEADAKTATCLLQLCPDVKLVKFPGHVLALTRKLRTGRDLAIYLSPAEVSPLQSLRDVVCKPTCPTSKPLASPTAPPPISLPPAVTLPPSPATSSTTYGMTLPSVASSCPAALLPPQLSRSTANPPPCTPPMPILKRAQTEVIGIVTANADAVSVDTPLSSLKPTPSEMNVSPSSTVASAGSSPMSLHRQRWQVRGLLHRSRSPHRWRRPACRPLSRLATRFPTRPRRSHVS